MEINKSESFSINNLSKEELLFILEVISKIQLTEESTELSFVIAEKFKKMSLNYLPQILDSLICEGCSLSASEEQICPLTNEKVLLCKDCYNKREALQNEFKQ